MIIPTYEVLAMEIVRVFDDDFTYEGPPLKYAINNSHEPKILEINGRHVGAFPAWSVLFFRYMDSAIDHYHMIGTRDFYDELSTGFKFDGDCNCCDVNFSVLDRTRDRIGSTFDPEAPFRLHSVDSDGRIILTADETYVG